MRLILILLLALASDALAQGRHEAARKAYLDGDSAGALTLWTEIAAEEGLSAELLAAMGNAEWRLGRKGRAMVCWERARLLDPGNAVASAGLRHAVSVGGVDRPKERWHESYAGLMEADAWTLAALASAWTVLLAWALPRLRGRRMADAHHRAALVGATVLALAGPGLWGSWSTHRRAVNRIPDEPLKLTPTQLGEPVATMGEGDVVRTGRRLNGHILVSLAGGQSGWVREAAAEPVAAEGLPRSLDGMP
jgi:hypothetical protein